jgi:hypothetical protein
MTYSLETTRSYAINLFSCNFSNSDNLLVSTLTSFGSTCSLILDRNKYYVGNNGCNPNKS